MFSNFDTSDVVPYGYSAGFTVGTGMFLKSMLNLNLTGAQNVLETTVAAITVASVIGAGLLKVRNHIRRVTKALDSFAALPLEELAKLPADFATTKKDLAAIQYQLSPNSGNSVSDKVDKMAKGQQAMSEVLRDLAHNVGALARKQQASFHLSDRCLLEFDAAGRCIFANRAYLRFTGRTESELMGTGWSSSFHPEDRRELADMWEMSIDSKSSMELGVRVSTVAGDYVAGNMQMTAVYTGQSLVAWLGVFTADKEHHVAHRAHVTSNHPVA